MSKVSRVVVAGSAVILALSTHGWAQTPAQPPVAQPRFDAAASATFRQIAASTDADRSWSGPGVSVASNGNLNEHLAITASVEKLSPAGVAALVGLQLSTGYFYGNNRDPVPGRFFARLLVGGARAETDTAHIAGQVDVGADVLLSRSRGVGFRWQIGYSTAPGTDRNYAYGRAALGIVFGPRVSS